MISLRPGLCSVTFRAHSPEEIIDAVVEAGLDVIEWGGDVHVPPGDLRTAERVASATSAAGLVSCSYGSYYRATPEEAIDPVLDSAEALGVDRVRIWAGRTSSAELSPSAREALACRIEESVDSAARRGIHLALEYHSGTLADTPESTGWLLRRVPNLSTYWQPEVGVSAEVALATYRSLASRVSAVHVFSWWPSIERLPLAARSDLWLAFVQQAQLSGFPPRDALMEFVRNDDIRVLVPEARSLRRFLDGGTGFGAEIPDVSATHPIDGAAANEGEST